MAFTVKLTRVPHLKLASDDVCFDVEDGDRKLGRVQISKGRIDWFVRKIRRALRLNWSQFSKVMEDNGKLVKTTKRRT